MKEEKVIQYLKDCNFWGKDNLYFYALAPESYSDFKNIFGVYAPIDIGFYIVNKNENGIGVIPFDPTGRSIGDLKLFLPNELIKEVYTENFKFFFIFSSTRLIIKTMEDEVVELKYTGKENGNLWKRNMYKFVSIYQK